MVHHPARPTDFLEAMDLGRKSNADSLVTWFKNFLDYCVAFKLANLFPRPAVCELPATY
jgi:hypothetical protein